MPGVPGQRLGLLDEVEGFAKSAIQSAGLGGNALYHVTNNNNSGTGSFRVGAEAGGNWIIFDGDYSISNTTNIALAAGTVVDGRGSTTDLSSKGLYANGVGDIVIANVDIHDITGAESDGIRIQGKNADGFWVHHCTFSEIIDGYIDFTEGGSTTISHLTVSYCRFNPGSTNWNELTMLYGDDIGTDDSKLKATNHHNYHNTTRQRHPLVSIGRFHSYNNYIAYDLNGIESRDQHSGAFLVHVVSENDIFDAKATTNAGDALDGTIAGYGYMRVDGELLVDHPSWPAGIHEATPASAFDPGDDYDYTLDSTTGLEATLATEAGVQDYTFKRRANGLWIA